MLLTDLQSLILDLSKQSHSVWKSSLAVYKIRIDEVNFIFSQLWISYQRSNHRIISINECMKCQIWKALKNISNSIQTEIMREYFKEKASDLSFRAFETLKDVTISGIFREWSKFQTAHLRFPQLDTSSCVLTEKEISCVS